MNDATRARNSVNAGDCTLIKHFGGNKMTKRGNTACWTFGYFNAGRRFPGKYFCATYGSTECGTKKPNQARRNRHLICPCSKAPCVPYSQEACYDAGKRLGLKMGGGSYNFAGDYSTKGCYTKKGGSNDGMVFYGVGGTEQQMKKSLSAPKYRPDGYDCLTQCASKGYVLRKSDHECKSADKKLGDFSSLNECANACCGMPECKFFIYGKLNKRCFWEKTLDVNCPEGWEDDSYDFYELKGN